MRKTMMNFNFNAKINRADMKELLTIAYINRVVYDTSDGRQQYIHFNKSQNTYEWQYQPDGFYQLPERIQYLKDSVLWQEVRDDYLNRKNNNKVASKKSRSLFAETINSLYNYYSN